ncbi:class E sortase [Candidatus Blastococcus massiliensis]|uniref:class E sortase n=1 Tax=Candidatus Blastococcus massiliensis TaxID=1470358 RepID=UPI001E659499|nr:class E sortase [Candidatus Blastococcus massiliensis]
MSDVIDRETSARQTRGGEERPRRWGDWLRTAARGVGQTLLTVGLVALLFVVYQLWVTDLLAARAQDQLAEQIQDQWADSPTVAAPPADPAPPTDPVPQPTPPDGSPAAPPAHTPGTIQAGLGDPFAILHIPRLGSNYSRVVVEGASEVQLEQGPGHYVDTAMPGEQGNFAVAGHRVGRGSPFLNLDRMRPGDPVVVETEDSWFVYRVLGDAASGDFDADPSGIPGRQIVRPSRVDVISPTPGRPAGGAPSGAYLTLTTCHPKYSAQQRLIVHARLDGAPLSKAAAPDGPPVLDG